MSSRCIAGLWTVVLVTGLAGCVLANRIYYPDVDKPHPDRCEVIVAECCGAAQYEALHSGAGFTEAQHQCMVESWRRLGLGQFEDSGCHLRMMEKAGGADE